ncbi:MAG: D-sedoheptulose 7-phosphate isomerase [Candidatus Ancaeobacter aquaticus]|nr:D-sedoheptulose 7-phosphate isomerase [Candidatus Ancaeobacter aquaticus]
MKEIIEQELKCSIDLKKVVCETSIPVIEKITGIFCDTLSKGNKILICGNGGSAADAQHMAAEFVGRYKKERKALPAISLSTDTSIITCIGNDYSFDTIFSRQVEALAVKDDLVLGISTSGNSENVIQALNAAHSIGARTVVFTGGDGGRIKDIAQCSFIVPSKDTPRIQEVHCTVMHIICLLVEQKLF